MRSTRRTAEDRPFRSGKVRAGSILATVMLLLAAAAVPAVVLADTGAGKVVLQFPAPGPSPSGLAWDGEALWVADESTDTIYKLDPANGRVISSFKTPGDQVCGLAWGDGILWCADNGTKKLQQLDAGNGRPLTELAAPLPEVQGRQPELGGLACHDGYLWTGTLAGWSSTMNQLDPRDGSVKRSLFTKGYPVALALNDQFIWNATHNDGHRLGLIYCYGLSDGLFVSQIDTPGFWPTGLAWDGECLWCVDRETKTIYRLTAR